MPSLGSVMIAVIPIVLFTVARLQLLLYFGGTLLLKPAKRPVDILVLAVVNFVARLQRCSTADNAL